MSSSKRRTEFVRCLISINFPHHLMLWQTLSALSSDHLPILIRLQMNTTTIPGLRRTYVNLKKENWDRYRQEVEATLSKHSLPTDCHRDEKIFRTVLLKAAPYHIPTGRHRLHEEPLPAEILDVMTSVKETPPRLNCQD